MITITLTIEEVTQREITMIGRGKEGSKRDKKLADTSIEERRKRKITSIGWLGGGRRGIKGEKRLSVTSLGWGMETSSGDAGCERTGCAWHESDRKEPNHGVLIQTKKKKHTHTIVTIIILLIIIITLNINSYICKHNRLSAHKSRQISAVGDEPARSRAARAGPATRAQTATQTAKRFVVFNIILLFHMFMFARVFRRAYVAQSLCSPVYLREKMRIERWRWLLEAILLN
jgi:hypothetical protein